MTRNNKALLAAARKSWGFTLIEVMTVVVIIGVLAAIAYPSYEQYVIRANRSAAQQFMLSIANRQEQYRLDARSYAKNVGAVACGLNLTAPPELVTRYTFSIDNTPADCPDATAYTITATAIGRQASDGALGLDSQGVKTPADKWKK